MWANSFKQYGCSPKYITEYLLDNYPNKYDIVWVFEPHIEVPYGLQNKVRIVRYFSMEYLRELHTAKFVICNISNYVPNKQILKEKFKSNKNEYEKNIKKYPLLNQLLFNEQKIKYLNNLPIIVYITNKMLDIYSYRKTSQEIKETKLIENEINSVKMKIKDFEINMKKYIKSYNYLNDIQLGKSCFSDENYMNKSVELFLINENNDINQLNNILNNFINYQNDFILNITEKYFCNNEIKEINVQEATEENVIRFCSSDDEFLSIFIKNTLMKKNEIFEFDFEEIENDLAEKIIPGLKKFVVGKIKTMKYKGDEINDEIIDYFKSKYKSEKLNQEQQDYIKEFLEKNEENKYKRLLKELKNLMLFIMTNSGFNLDIQIQDIINNLSEKYLDNNNEFDLIKEFFFGDLEKDDDLAQMNDDNNNIVFGINNLYPLYTEIEKSIKKK